MRFILLLLLFYSCHVDSGFQDLTPDNKFNTAFYFNSPAFATALNNVGKAKADTVFEIKRPESLLPPPLFGIEEGWMTTDTFAFETGDFQKVVNVIVRTAEKHRKSIHSAMVSNDLGSISLSGRTAYSYPNKYYLVPFELSNGEHIYIQITRTKSKGKGFWTTWYYSANGLWMIGKDAKVKTDKDVS